MKFRIAILIGLLGLPVVYADTTPSAESIYPSGTGAPTNTKLLIRSACCVANGESPVTLRAGSQVVSGVSEFIGYSWLVFTPAQPLQPGTSYTVTVTINGHTPSTGTFTTGASADTTPPTMVSSTPGNLQDSLALGQSIKLRFSKPLNPKSLASTAVSLVELASGSPYYGSKAELSDPTTVELVLAYTLAPGKVYRVYFPGALPQDLSGNVLPQPAPDFLFTTYPEAPKDGARLTLSIPGEAATAVPTNSALTLVFDRPVMTPAGGALTLSAEGDANVPLTVEPIEVRNMLIVRPQALLRGNRLYTLSAGRIYDQYGGQVATGPLLRFTTGALPELQAFTQVSGPASTMPNSRKVRWSYSRAVNPYLIPRLRALTTGIETEARLLDDGLTLEADLQGPGQYVLTGLARDRVQCKATGSYESQFLVTPTPDDEAPSALGTFPADQSGGVPPTVSPSIQFSETVESPTADQFQIRQGEARVAATVSGSFATFTIRPSQPLMPGAEYRVEFRAPRDLAGNVGADVAWSFRVDAAAALEPFHLTQADPGYDSIGVAGNTPIVLTFNRPPNPVTLIATTCSPVSTAAGTITGRWRVDGNRAIFQPERPWPATSRIAWTSWCTRDVYGQSLPVGEGIGAFWTAASTQPAPPFRVAVITPAAGESAVAGSGAVTLRFNQDVAGSTINRNTLWVSNLTGERVDDGPMFNSATGQVSLSVNSTLSSDFIVNATSEIRSLNGTRLEPFTATVRLLSQVTAFGSSQDPVPPSFLRSASIPNQAGVAIANPPVVIHFYAPMDRALVEQALRVVLSNAAVPGRIEWAPDSAALTYYPSIPVPAPSGGYVLLSLVPWTRGGVESVAIQTGSAPQSDGGIRWNHPQPLPSDAILEASFDRDVPAGFVKTATARSVSTSNEDTASPHVIPLQVSQRTPRIFRFTSSQLFERSTYTVELETVDGRKESGGFVNAMYSTPISRRIDAGPTDEMGEVPLNAIVWLEAHTLLNPFTLNPRITNGGEQVRVVTEIADNGMLILLRPVGLLRGNSTYTVELKGLEDLAGRPLPDRTWTFHTGAGADLTRAKLTSWTPKGSASTASTLQATFSRPVFFRRTWTWDVSPLPYDFVVSPGRVPVQGSIQASPDGRTLSYLPNRPWPVDTEVSLSVDDRHYFDWTGNAIAEVRESSGNNLVIPTFTASSAVAAQPMVRVRNPLPDAIEVPRNVRIQARYENGVLESSLARALLTSGGSDVPVRTSLARDGRTVTMVPLQPLEANRLYTVALTGILSSDGTPRDEAEQWSFTTSDIAVGVPETPLVVPVRSNPVSFRLLFSRPVNPVSIASGILSVYLNERQVAVEVAMEEDASAVRITPLAPEAAGGSWQVSSGGLTDSAGLPFPPAGVTVAVEKPDAGGPPQVLSLLPAPGSTVAWNSSAVAVFDRAFTLSRGTSGARITLDGVPVTAKVQFPSSTSIALTPFQNWSLGATYYVELSGVMDAEGNEAPPVSWSFTIGPGATGQPSNLRLTSASPAQFAVGVPSDTPIVFEFSRPVYLWNNLYGQQVVFQPQLPAAPKVVYDQNRLRIEPAPSWRPGQLFGVQIWVRDAYGQSISTGLNFTPAALQDTRPPVLESVTPPPGRRLQAGRNEFRLRMSEPVDVLGPPAGFTCDGISLSTVRVTMPAQGDGRTVIVAFDLPESTSCRMDLLPYLTDLSGNVATSATFMYSVDPVAGNGEVAVSSLDPADGSYMVPLDAVITLKFNQPMNPASVRNAVHVTNDGYSIPITLTPDDANQVWTLVPSAPWRPGSLVDVEVGTSAFGATGWVMYSPFTARFHTVGNEASSIAGSSLAAIQAFPSFVDLRFAAPLAAPPEEPFGLRLGQTRIPVVVDRMGPAWYRLTPGTRLDPGEHYTLMAGPGVEIPLRITQEETTDQTSVPVVTRDEAGRLMMQFETPIPAFSVDATTLVLLDRAGRQVPHTASLSPDGRTVVVEPLGIAPVQGLRWKDHRVATQAR